MAREIENININGEAYEISKIYSKMGLTFERFVELLERDFYSPVLSADPTSTVTTYTDTDGSEHDFQQGQFALVADASVTEGYKVWQCLSNDGTEAVWISPSEKADKEEIPTRVSQLVDDVGMVTSKDTDGSVDDVEIEYQEKLVSGTNIKTINGTSILGSGNIVIEGGSSSGSTSSGSSAYSLVEHGTSNTTFTLTPNTFHVWDEVASLDLSFGDETSGVANEFLFQFTSGATATTLTLPDDIKWANDTAPTIAENMIYQVSVLRGLASVLEFSNAIIISTFHVLDDGDEDHFINYIVGSTWGSFVNSDYNAGRDSIEPFYINEGKVCAYHKYADMVWTLCYDAMGDSLVNETDSIDNSITYRLMPI